jgi:hypothetical protein
MFFSAECQQFSGKIPRPCLNTALAYGLVSLKQHNSPSFVTSCQIVACVVELDGRDNVGWRGWYVSIRLNHINKHEGQTRQECVIRVGSFDLKPESLTFCDVLYITLITKASDAEVSNGYSCRTRPNRSRASSIKTSQERYPKTSS